MGKYHLLVEGKVFGKTTCSRCKEPIPVGKSGFLLFLEHGGFLDNIPTLYGLLCERCKEERCKEEKIKNG